MVPQDKVVFGALALNVIKKSYKLYKRPLIFSYLGFWTKDLSVLGANFSLALPYSIIDPFFVCFCSVYFLDTGVNLETTLRSAQNHFVFQIIHRRLTFIISPLIYVTIVVFQDQTLCSLVVVGRFFLVFK